MDDAMKQLNESFSTVLSVYFSYFQLEPIDVEIILAEKKANIYRQKRPYLFEGEHIINSEDVERNMGLTIPPKTIDEKFTIVIKFVLWTEFHARATGYFFMRKFIFGEKYNDKSDKEQTDNILQKELPFQINWFSQQYEAANGNADIQLYETMQFMGRYSIWEKLFPNVFNKRARQQVFGSNPWMLDIIRTNFGGH